MAEACATRRPSRVRIAVPASDPSTMNLRARCLDHRDRRLLGGGQQAISDNFVINRPQLAIRVDHHRVDPPLSSRVVPPSRKDAVHPAGTRIVDSTSSIIAGPATELPGEHLRRMSTGVETKDPSAIDQAWRRSRSPLSADPAACSMRSFARWPAVESRGATRRKGMRPTEREQLTRTLTNSTDPLRPIPKASWWARANFSRASFHASSVNTTSSTSTVRWCA